jgi:D-sedoheptulose 7-phosphate isomerase
MSHSFFKTVGRISSEIYATVIDRLAHELGALCERRGRLFLLGVGGSAGNCGRLLRGFA